MLVSLGDDLEEEVCSGLVHLPIADLIDDEQIGFDKHLNLLLNRIGHVGGEQRLHEIVRGDEIDGVALLDCFQT